MSQRVEVVSNLRVRKNFPEGSTHGLPTLTFVRTFRSFTKCIRSICKRFAVAMRTTDIRQGSLEFQASLVSRILLGYLSRGSHCYQCSLRDATSVFPIRTLNVLEADRCKLTPSRVISLQAYTCSVAPRHATRGLRLLRRLSNVSVGRLASSLVDPE